MTMPTGETAHVSSNKALVRRWFEEVWNKGDAAAIDGMLASNAGVHGIGTSDLSGPAGFTAFHRTYRDAFPDVRVVVNVMVAEGDAVAFRWTATGTYSGKGLGGATGRGVEFDGMGFVRIQNGQITEGWNMMDEVRMFRQIGVATIPE